jgi:hypothetical protein
MVHTLFGFVALHTAVFILLTGVGLLGMFLSLRMRIEGFSEQVIGVVYGHENHFSGRCRPRPALGTATGP